MLVGSLVGPLEGLTVLVASFGPLAKKAKEYEQQSPSERSADDTLRQDHPVKR